MQAQNMQLGGTLDVMRNVGTFIIKESFLGSIRTGRALSRLRGILTFAARRRWERVLAYSGSASPKIRDHRLGLIRLADTDDEDDEGIFPVELDFVNCFCRLQLSRGRHEPVDIISDFLGFSPLP